MANETIGEQLKVMTPDHPTRVDSPRYRDSRTWLMSRPGGCFVCGDTAVASAEYEDHHGGGLWWKGAIIGFNLFGLEWSLGWGADPAKIASLVAQQNLLNRALSEPTYDEPITNTEQVMQYVDSIFNANVRLCRHHHVAHQTEHTPDANGHEAVGIHEAPFPIWIAQLYCNWSVWDMWGGTTGTLAVAPAAGQPGHAQVLYRHAAHPTEVKVGQVLPPTHPAARAAHAGYR